MADPARCIRCDTNPAVDTEGLCGHCRWAVRAEIEAGLYELRRHLEAHARFSAWLVEHGQQP